MNLQMCQQKLPKLKYKEKKVWRKHKRVFKSCEVISNSLTEVCLESQEKREIAEEIFEEVMAESSNFFIKANYFLRWGEWQKRSQAKTAVIP